MFARLGSWCFRRRRTVVLLWLAALVVVGGVSSAVGSSFGQDFQPPGSESTRGIDTLNEEFGGFGAGIRGTIVFKADAGIDDPEVRSAMEGLFAQVEALSDDPDLDVEEHPAFADLTDDQRDAIADADLQVMDGMGLVSPYSPEGSSQIAGPDAGEAAGKIAFASLEVPGEDWDEVGDVGVAIAEIAPHQAGLRVEVGGAAFGGFEEPSSETLGLAFAVVILVAAFGSVIAMGLPIGVAIAGIAAGSVIVTILSNLLTMPDFAPVLGIMIGLGVGIDYALFIVTRYRENLHHGHTPEEAASIAIDTAGRAVAFAGVTVVVSFLGMMVMGVSFIQGLAISSAVVVAMTVVASLTLLPALLGFVGGKIEISRWRGVVATGFVALALVGVGLKISALAGIGFVLAVATIVLGLFAPPLKRVVVRRPPKPMRQTFAYRWSRWVQHRPWPAAIGGALVLLVLAVPVLGLRLGFSDESNFADDTTTKQAYELLVDGFGPGFNGPFVLVAKVDGPADTAVLDGITEAVRADAGVASVSPAIPNTQGGDQSTTAYVWQVTPTSAPQDERTTQLVHRLRDDVLVPGEEAIGTEIAVTGMVPGTVDFSGFLSERMPYFFAAVLLLSFLLMMAVFRSVLVPLKAVLMNLLSIGAAYGITVAIVQWGWLSDLTGLTPGPIETFAPMMFFAIVFGLSMDYEVFLLSRVKEEYRRSGDSHMSVANGLAATARVITAAAAIMVFVFGSFLLENERTFKLFGIGLASAILLDATIVRMLLVPATMELLGDRNWWLPRWLDRLLPNINVEGTPDDIDEFAVEERDLEPV
ncbi:MAG: MMPL family transporter [Acidimicrobiales bacterium]|nr:MMPL family transporter [Acidimicrobiales bacterium]